MTPHAARPVRSIASRLVVVALVSACGGAYEENPVGEGPAPVSLGTDTDLAAAGGYVILAKTGITNVTGSTVTGNIGVSPVAASFITGFSLVEDAARVFGTSSSVVGKVYAADYASPTPANLTSAIGSMETAYNDAAGRTTPDFTELATGNLGGLTLAPGLYKWSNSVTIPTDVTISGAAGDTWIFQVAGDLSIDAAKRVTLAGGALAKNVVWQVAGRVTVGTTAQFAGTVLTKTAVTLNTNASHSGRLYAQSLVALDNNAVSLP